MRWTLLFLLPLAACQCGPADECRFDEDCADGERCALIEGELSCVAGVPPNDAGPGPVTIDTFEIRGVDVLTNTTYRYGAELLVSWTTTGADDCNLSLEGELIPGGINVTEATDLSVTPEVGTLQLDCTNDAGDTSATVTLADATPIVDAAAAEPTDTVLVSWVANGPCNVLVDDVSAATNVTNNAGVLAPNAGGEYDVDVQCLDDGEQPVIGTGTLYVVDLAVLNVGPNPADFNQPQTIDWTTDLGGSAEQLLCNVLVDGVELAADVDFSASGDTAVPATRSGDLSLACTIGGADLVIDPGVVITVNALVRTAVDFGAQGTNTAISWTVEPVGDVECTLAVENVDNPTPLVVFTGNGDGDNVNIRASLAGPNEKNFITWACTSPGDVVDMTNINDVVEGYFVGDLTSQGSLDGLAGPIAIRVLVGRVSFNNDLNITNDINLNALRVVSQDLDIDDNVAFPANQLSLTDLERIGGNLEIDNLAGGIATAAFPALVRVNGGITFSDNVGLASVDFPELRRVFNGNFLVSRNFVDLASFTAPKLIAVGGAVFTIDNNNALTLLDIFPADDAACDDLVPSTTKPCADHAGNSFSIFNNASLCPEYVTGVNSGALPRVTTGDLNPITTGNTGAANCPPD